MSGRDLLTDERRLFEDLCAREYLAAGFQRVRKNKGAPGIDGVTIAEFETRLDDELVPEREIEFFDTSAIRAASSVAAFLVFAAHYGEWEPYK